MPYVKRDNNCFVVRWSASVTLGNVINKKSPKIVSSFISYTNIRRHRGDIFIHWLTVGVVIYLYTLADGASLIMLTNNISHARSSTVVIIIYH